MNAITMTAANQEEEWLGSLHPPPPQSKEYACTWHLQIKTDDPILIDGVFLNQFCIRMLHYKPQINTREHLRPWGFQGP